MGKIKNVKDFPLVVRLKILGRRQLDLVEPLAKRGFAHISPSLLSLAINGHIVTPHGEKLRNAISEILTEWEAK